MPHSNSIELNFKTSKIYLGNSGEVKADGNDVTPTWEKIYRSKDSLKITKAGNKTIVSVHQKHNVEILYLELEWDGASTVYVTVHGTYFNRTLGLCGMWDGDQTNDLEPKADGVIHYSRW